MRNRLITRAVLCLGLLVVLAASGAHALERQLCTVCGRDWLKSPCRMKYAIEIGTKSSHFTACSPFCLCEHLEKYAGRDYKLISERIVDYNELSEQSPLFLRASKATYLSGIKGDEQRTARPFVAAFKTKELAKEAQQELGGELLSWDELFAKCVELAADYEAPKPDSYRRTRHP